MASAVTGRRDPAARPSPLVRDAVERFGLAPKRFLDLACGFGRNTRYLAGLGGNGVAIDSDRERTHQLRTSLARTSSQTIVKTDDEHRFLRECETKFDFVCCTDYWRPRLLTDLYRVASDGAWIVFNTPAARGGNWHALPESNQVVRDLVSVGLEIVDLRITDAGRQSPARAAVCLIARS